MVGSESPSVAPAYTRMALFGTAATLDRFVLDLTPRLSRGPPRWKAGDGWASASGRRTTPARSTPEIGPSIRRELRQWMRRLTLSNLLAASASQARSSVRFGSRRTDTPLRPHFRSRLAHSRSSATGPQVTCCRSRSRSPRCSGCSEPPRARHARRGVIGHSTDDLSASRADAACPRRRPGCRALGQAGWYGELHGRTLGLHRGHRRPLREA